jgi:hypothetical protein
MTTLAKATVVLMPVCETVQTVGPTPAGGQRHASRLDGKVQEVHDDWGCVIGIGGIGHPHWSGCHVGEAR